MLKYYTTLGILALSTTVAYAGGWETGRLDTEFLYQDGSYLEAKYGSLDYSVNATSTTFAKHSMAKDQNRVSVSGKFQIGNFDIGLTSFGSGAIQIDGQNATGVSVVPSADVKLNTQALMARYSFNDKYSIIGGVRQAKLKASTLNTVAPADYSIDAIDKFGMVYGLAYERPDIALKFEVLRSEKITIGLTGDVIFSGGTVPVTGTLVIPEATSINFQTGIAENTLLMATAHNVNWAGSDIKLNVSLAPPLNQSSNFSNTTRYSLGLGRRLNEATSASLTYSWEKGTNSGGASTSPFTMSNGSQTLTAGVKHKIGSITISSGISYTKVGDVDVTHSTGLTANYAGNTVTAVGVKFGYNF